MSLFKRKPKPLPPREPDVYVCHTSTQGRTTVRLYFIDKLWPNYSTSEGSLSRDELLSNRQKMLQLFEELKEVTGAARLNPHHQYIALHEFASNTSHEDVEDAAIAVLAKYFGWSDPLVDHFDFSSDKMHRVERLRGVNWRVSS